MKKLLIMRHSKTEKNDSKVDFERVLTSKGEKDAKLMGKIIYGLEFVPDIIVSSPAARAKLTAKIIANECKYKGDIGYIDNLYPGEIDDIVKVVSSFDEKFETIVLVGHNPSLDDFVNELTKAKKGTFSLSTSCVVSLKLPELENWSDFSRITKVQLEWILSPKILNMMNGYK